MPRGPRLAHGDVVDFALRSVQRVFNVAPVVHAVADHVVSHANERAPDAVFLDDSAVVLHVRRRWDETHQVGKVYKPARAVKLSRAFKRVGERDHIDRVARLTNGAHGLKDALMRILIKIFRF